MAGKHNLPFLEMKKDAFLYSYVVQKHPFQVLISREEYLLFFLLGT